MNTKSETYKASHTFMSLFAFIIIFLVGIYIAAPIAYNILNFITSFAPERFGGGDPGTLNIIFRSVVLMYLVVYCSYRFSLHLFPNANIGILAKISALIIAVPSIFYIQYFWPTEKDVAIALAASALPALYLSFKLNKDGEI